MDEIDHHNLCPGLDKHHEMLPGPCESQILTQVRRERLPTGLRVRAAVSHGDTLGDQPITIGIGLPVPELPLGPFTDIGKARIGLW